MRTVWSVLGLIAKLATVWLSFQGACAYVAFFGDLWHMSLGEAVGDLCITVFYCSSTLLSLYIGLKYDELVQGKHKAQAEVVYFQREKSARRKAA